MEPTERTKGERYSRFRKYKTYKKGKGPEKSRTKNLSRSKNKEAMKLARKEIMHEELKRALKIVDASDEYNDGIDRLATERVQAKKENNYKDWVLDMMAEEEVQRLKRLRGDIEDMQYDFDDDIEKYEKAYMALNDILSNTEKKKSFFSYVRKKMGKDDSDRLAATLNREYKDLQLSKYEITLITRMLQLMKKLDKIDESGEVVETLQRLQEDTIANLREESIFNELEDDFDAAGRRGRGGGRGRRSKPRKPKGKKKKKKKKKENDDYESEDEEEERTFFGFKF